PSVQIGRPPVESPASDRAETPHLRDVRLEVSRRDETRALQSRAHRGDELLVDVRDPYIALRKRVDTRIETPQVQPDPVRGRVCPGRHDRMRVAVDTDDRGKAQLRRSDRDHARAAADVEQPG